MSNRLKFLNKTVYIRPLKIQSCDFVWSYELTVVAYRPGVGNFDPGGPVSLQSLAPTLIKHLNQLIKVFRMQLGFFFQGWS